MMDPLPPTDPPAHPSADSWSRPTFPLSHRCRRLFWRLCWMLLCAWTPIPFHAWRATVLRLFGATIGRGCFIYPDSRIWAPWNLHLGDQATLGPLSTIYCMARITLGKRAIISQGAHLCTGTHDIRDPAFPLITRPITIGALAWVSAEAFVGPGVTMGDGSVLGARGVLMRDAESLAILVGNPAKVVGRRPDSVLAGIPGHESS